MKNSQSENRKVSDSMGELKFHNKPLWRTNARAINNFPVSSRKMPLEFINTLILIKGVATKTNAEQDV